MAFPALDVVFGLTTGAIDFLVKIFAAIAVQTGHDKARVAPHGPDLYARNDAAFFAPMNGLRRRIPGTGAVLFPRFQSEVRHPALIAVRA